MQRQRRLDTRLDTLADTRPETPALAADVHRYRLCRLLQETTSKRR